MLEVQLFESIRQRMFKVSYMKYIFINIANELNQLQSKYVTKGRFDSREKE